MATDEFWKRGIRDLPQEPALVCNAEYSESVRYLEWNSLTITSSDSQKDANRGLFRHKITLCADEDAWTV